MFSKILVCSDSSECARKAALTTAAIARRFGSEVLALNVFDLSFFVVGDVGMGTVPIDQEALNVCIESAREEAERAVKTVFDQACVPYKMIQELGHPVDGILNVAEREKIDLIVLGSRGLTGIKEFVLGSVSHGVLHHALCPVLIAGNECSVNDEAGFQHILMASDGSESAEKAANIAVKLARKFGTSLTVLNVIEPHPALTVGHDAAADSRVGLHPDANSMKTFDRIHKAVQRASDETGVACSFRREGGRAAETIIQFAHEQGTDLIVMGSRGLGGFKRLLIGSVSNNVAHHAGCPILVVR